MTKAGKTVWRRILLGSAAYIVIGIVVDRWTFDYPAGLFWHAMAVLLWPALLLLLAR